MLIYRFRKLLRGSASLPFAFWVIGVVGNGVFRVIDAYLLETGYYVFSAPENALAGSTFLVLDLSYGVFSMISVWNSAGNYDGPKKWSVLAKFWVVVGGLAIALNILGLIDPLGPITTFFIE